jgi:hypothetical protein
LDRERRFFVEMFQEVVLLRLLLVEVVVEEEEEVVAMVKGKAHASLSHWRDGGHSHRQRGCPSHQNRQHPRYHQSPFWLRGLEVVEAART